MSRSAVETGAGSYTLDIAGPSNVLVRVRYQVDGGLVQQFETRVDEDGEVTFRVGPDTMKGALSLPSLPDSGSVRMDPG